MKKLILIAFILLCFSLIAQNKVYQTLKTASDSAVVKTNNELKVNRFIKMVNDADSAFNSVSKEKQVFKSELNSDEIYHLIYLTRKLDEDRLLYLLINDLITTREYLYLINLQL